MSCSNVLTDCPCIILQQLYNLISLRKGREREREREGFSLDLSDRHERGKCYSVRFEKSKARNIGHA